MALKSNAVILTKPEALETVVPVANSPAPSDVLQAPPRRANSCAEAKVDHREDSDDDHDNDDSWETDSLIERHIDDASPPEFSSDPNSCTPEEIRYYRNLLHDKKLEGFIEETLGKQSITARKLCSAFHVRMPPWLLGPNEPDQSYYRLLGVALVKELAKRQRLSQYKTIDDAAKLLQSAKNVVIVTGAGISTSLGIPDFRSKSTGFYSKLREMGFEEPEEVFDLSHFDEDPTTFYTLAGDILPDLYRWTPTHQFIRLLQDRGKLLRDYTQNIDNVESHAGILKEKIVQCHGSWATASCRKCGFRIPGEDIFDSVKAKEVAKCKRCIESLAAPKPQGMKRKRSRNGNGKPRKRTSDDSDDDSEYDIPEPGVMKPDITFFGEKLPDAFFETISRDRGLVDLVIVIGTSMKVAPVSEIPGFVEPEVPQIYISRDPIYHINFDVNLLGDCDTVVEELCRRAGWDLKHEMVPENQRVEVSPVEEGDGHVWSVKPVSSSPAATSGLLPDKSERVKTETATTVVGTETSMTAHSQAAFSRKPEAVAPKSEVTVATA